MAQITPTAGRRGVALRRRQALMLPAVLSSAASRTTAAQADGVDLLLVLAVTASAYGYHRDELYFRMLPPAWGYTDQPPLTPLLVHGIAQLVDTVWAIRIPAMLFAAASVVVGNPQIADVTVVDEHTLFISGRGFGVTEVVVLDGMGRTIYQSEVVVSAPSSGQVRVWRGSTVTDMACSTTCAPSVRGVRSSSRIVELGRSPA